MFVDAVDYGCFDVVVGEFFDEAAAVAASVEFAAEAEVISSRQSHYCR